ncbi:hypothetical protein CMT41_07300 [Colwellia sp. MT41]|uniref:hypothetical protein n=1 Tax=Colwellia sp. MT41 TaxID=58049 RepID=UPI00071777A6|nr:hypothetical protein [Colwellia sp. MT41]ALO34543.1 hypothetical protein CMT41_07300 [Colwellia sp. MT41]
MSNISTNEPLQITEYQSNNDKLLANYLIACDVDTTYQKQVVNLYVQDLTINFELRVSEHIIYLELVNTPEDAQAKKEHYKYHFTYPILFFIDYSIPTHAFYEHLVRIFTTVLPLSIILSFNDCLL